MMNCPIQISARLLPAVKIGDSWLSFEPVAKVFYLDTPDGDYVLTGFRFYGNTSIEALSTCLSFMMAAAEAQDAADAGRFSDYNDDIFPLDIMRWCQKNASEFGWVQYELGNYK